MFGTRIFAAKVGRGLALAAVAGALVFQAPTPATAQGVDAEEVGKVIPHMLEVPDQSDQIRGFESLTRTKGLILLFSRSLQW